MKYISTRGGMAPATFSDILLAGLAPDGGLAMCESYPQLSRAELDAMRAMSYPELAFDLIRRFADDIPAADLKAIVDKTYTRATYGTDEITPLKRLEDGLYIQELSNGPTLAFKDMAMQLLGNLFEYTLAKQGETLNILGATSGDTGSAAEYAMRGKQGVRVFMLSPHEKMSPFQTAQMFSLQDPNIFNLAVRGVFDDCQDIVKAVSNDHAFKAKYKIGTVNSINWARVVAQVVYYFKGYFAATQSNDEHVSFSVPSGNFGNVCAGHIARMMGLPIRKLIVATNENDVLNDFFQTGKYSPRTADKTYVTSSPSMDISKASNFERFIYLLEGKNGETIQQLWADVNSGKGFDLSNLLGDVSGKYGFTSGKSTHADRIATIKQVYAEDDELIDPHTADGVKVAREVRNPGETIVCAETALPAKFSETITEAVGTVDIPRPANTQGIESLPQQVVELTNDANLVRQQIETHVKPL